MLWLSYWIVPVISGVVWLATILTLLLYWIVATGKTHYPYMASNQSIAYISDVAASNLKPLFIAGCVITTLTLDLSFGADRWLRHNGRLVPNATVGEKVLSGLTIFFALVGTAGLVLLSVFDTRLHKNLHDIFLLVFIVGYVLSAVFICWEYQRLGSRNRSHKVLRVSFWIKLVFVLLAVVLAAIFAAMTVTGRYNAGAILEWAISFVFTLYIVSFYVDLYPAVYTKNGGRRRHTSKGLPGSFFAVNTMRGGEMAHGEGGGGDVDLVGRDELGMGMGTSPSTMTSDGSRPFRDIESGRGGFMETTHAVERRRPLDDE